MVHLSPSVTTWEEDGSPAISSYSSWTQVDYPKSAWPFPLAKAFEPVCKTDILKESLHMEQIGYTNTGSFA